MRLKMERDKAEIKKEAEGIRHKGTETRMQGALPGSSNHMNQINQVKQMNEIKEINEINQTNQINQINANKAKESEVRTVMGGVSGRGNHFSNLKSQISNLKSLRMALMALLALVMILGLGSSAEAVLAKYAIDVSGGTANVATGISYNYGVCGDRTPGSNTNLVKDADGSCDDRVELTSPGIFFNTYYNTAYTQNTQVAGQATGNRFTIRERSGKSATVTFELYYVMPDGTETSLGTYDMNIPANFDDEIEPDLSALGGVVPAGGKIGYRFSYTGASTRIRVYFGPTNGRNTYSGQSTGWITVDETPACSATAPNDLQATNVQSTQVDLAWTYDGTSNDYYNIYRDGVQIATNITTGSYTDTAVSPSTTYNYTVRGYSNAGACESGDSNVATVTTPSCTDPDPTAGVTVTPASGSTVSGTVTVQATVSGESTPGSGSATVTISGSSACDVTNQNMTWNSGTGAFEYSWDTSACGNPAENPITISVDYTDPDCGAVTTGSSTNITIDNTGPKYTVTSCSDCHDYPPTDATGQRNTPVGAVVGSHSKHPFDCSKCHIKPTTFDHRDGNIDMASPINGDSGASYSKGTSFPQVNDLTGSGLGTCSNVSCHGGSTTPTWGIGTTTCSSCHTNDMGLTATVRRGIFKAGNDFTKTSHHITGTPVDASCTVCHDRSNHTQEGDPNVRVFNEDTGAAIVYDGTGGSLEGFCVSCHDSNGASRLGANATKPFADSGDNTAPPDIGWTIGTVAHSSTSLSDKCMACHGNSGAAGTTLDPVINAHGSDETKLMRFVYNIIDSVTTAGNICYNCHGNTPQFGAKAIKDQFDLTGGRHSSITCLDCHNQHQAEVGNHTQGSTTLAGVLKGVSGVTPTWNPGVWSGASALTSGTADAEYKVCFKCHAATGTTLTPFDPGSGSGSGASSFTNLAVEFSPNNESGHPVVTNLNNYPNSDSPKGLLSSQMAGGWSGGGNDIMTCTDCHATSLSGAKGPHGSAVKWMLAGTNKAWPYTSAANNGTSSGTYRRWNNITTGNDDGVFCANCHDVTTAGHDARGSWTGREKAHTNVPNSGTGCVGCHVRVPHGAKTSRLITGANAPARYKPDGNGGGTIYLYGILKWSGNPNKDNCWSENSQCGDHKGRSAGKPVW